MLLSCYQNAGHNHDIKVLRFFGDPCRVRDWQKKSKITFTKNLTNWLREVCAVVDFRTVFHLLVWYIK
jgi:hypothetical protein